MITNERQYRITRAQAAKISQALRTIKEDHAGSTEKHPLVARAQKEALSSQLADLQSDLREYEALKEGEFRLDRLAAVYELPSALIKARISQGLTQKGLAERMGLKEQQIQRYETTDYASASLSRIKEVASALYDPAGESAES